MAAPPVGVILALTGDDAPLVRALDVPGTGLRVVRRCGDLPELLSAGLAGLGTLVVLDTRFDDVDRTVLARLERAGAAGLLLAPEEDRERWQGAGWPVLGQDAPAELVRDRLLRLARPRGETGAPGPGAVALGTPAAARSERRGSEGAGTDGGGPDGARGDADGAARTGPDGADALEAEWAALDATGRADVPTAGSASSGLSGDARASAGPAVSSGSARTGADGATGATGPDGPGPAGSGPTGSVPGPAGTQEERGRLVVVWGPHGAPGRTTVAAALAHGLGRAGGALLIDADVEAPSLVQVLGLPDDSSGLATAARLAAHGRLDDEALGRLVTEVTEGVELLSGLGRAGRWRELPPVAAREVWERARRRAAWTVVDVAGGAVDDEVDDFTLEPGRGAVVADLLRSVDVVVVLGAGDPVGVRRLLQLLGDLTEEHRPSGRVEVVVNRVRASVAGASPERAVRETLERFGGLSEVTVLPEDGASADRCLLEGVSVLEGAPGSGLGRALAGLVERLDPTARAPRASGRRGRGVLGLRR